MKKEFYRKLGINIKKCRESEELTQQALADKIKKSLNFIGKIEVAFSKPSLNTLIDIAEALNTNVSELSKLE